MAAPLRHQGARKELTAAKKLFTEFMTSIDAGAAATAAPYLSLSGVTKSFGKTTVVDRVSFCADKGEFICILGPSGCGKTTLLRLVAGFERTESGTIVQAGQDITRLRAEERDFGIVFQSYALFPNRSVVGNIAFGLEATAVAKATRSRRVQELLELVGLEEHGGKYPSQLSGGQQQRVALARALALSPGLLLLDEPLSALDVNVRTRLRQELLSLQRRIGVTTVMVTHDQHEALAIADRILVMNQGKIEQVGRPQEVFENPANLFVARFLGEMNAIAIDPQANVEAQAGPYSMPALAGSVKGKNRPHLCIRPAAVVVGPEATAHEKSEKGRVLRVQYSGDRVRLTFQMIKYPQIEVDAELPRIGLGSLPKAGDEMDLALPSQHTLLLDDQT